MKCGQRVRNERPQRRAAVPLLLVVILVIIVGQLYKAGG